MAASDNPSVSRRWYAILVLLALALLVGSGWWWRKPHVVAMPPVRKIVGQAVRPQPRSNDYVGSQECAKCHATIAETYAGHSMYRSAGRTPGEDDVENFDDGTKFEFPDGRVYRVEKRDDGIYHHEILYDNQGELIYDQSAKISYFIGSGTRGKSYAIDRDGILFQSPISWYTSEKKWDLSPGYAYRHVRFGRRIPYECVVCHAGRPTHDANHEDYFPEQVLIEAAIGCERCHGPGKEHIAFHDADDPPATDDPIINPARLDPDRREAVCYQCHLIGKERFPRYGRTFDDFRPGDRLDDVWATMVASSSVRGDRKTKAVSHVEQMRESTCFIKSEGRFGCTSCHGAHSSPSKEDADVYYRQRCLDCHADTGCSLPIEKQAAAPANDSCIYCHMPKLTAHDIAHASQTDHRILRSQDVDEADGPPGDPAEKLVLFDEEHTVMPEWELERALALSKVRKLMQTNFAAQAVADELRETLSMIAAIAPDDAPTWDALATVADLRQDPTTARKQWTQALALAPNDEWVLYSLVGVCQREGDYQAALDYCDRLIELNPNRARDYDRRARLLSQFDRWPQAIADLEKAVGFEPLDRPMRRLLIHAYRQVGNLAGVTKHEEVLKQIASLRVPPG
jgi:predicted CXXCH cytochrome family protein